jgi:hypothetical protein
VRQTPPDRLVAYARVQEVRGAGAAAKDLNRRKTPYVLALGGHQLPDSSATFTTVVKSRRYVPPVGQTATSCHVAVLVPCQGHAAQRVATAERLCRAPTEMGFRRNHDPLDSGTVRATSPVITIPGGYAGEEMLAGLAFGLDQIPGHLLRSTTFDQGSKRACVETATASSCIKAGYATTTAHGSWIRWRTSIVNGGGDSIADQT